MSKYPKMEIGQKVRFEGERKSFTVQAVSESGRWVALTQPFNLRNTVMYTVIDWELGIRGADNCFGLGYETPEQCQDALAQFEMADEPAEISYRNWVWLRYADKQPDKRTEAMLPELRRITAEAPPRHRNDFAPRA